MRVCTGASQSAKLQSGLIRTKSVESLKLRRASGAWNRWRIHFVSQNLPSAEACQNEIESKGRSHKRLT